MSEHEYPKVLNEHGVENTPVILKNQRNGVAFTISWVGPRFLRGSIH